MKRMLKTAAALVLALILTAGCLAGAEGRAFTDDCGRTVELPEVIERIVPAGPLPQIALYAVAPDLFCGLAAKWVDAARGIVPEDILALPFFGQLYGSADLNVEELALAAPDLLVDVGAVKGSTVEDMDEMQARTAIPSVHIEMSLSTMGQAFRRLGELLGREEKAEALAAFCERTYERTVSVMERVGDNKVKTLYVLGADGLSVYAKGSYQSELLDLLTDNAAVIDNPSGRGTGNEVTMEQIALWNPDFVIFAPGSIYESAAELDTWRDMDAIANGQYVQAPEGPHNWMGTPPSCQRVLGMIWLTALLYPDECDYDVKSEILDCYELFYGVRLTDEQYEALTARAFPVSAAD